MKINKSKKEKKIGCGARYVILNPDSHHPQKLLPKFSFNG
jgi:hypothetical protein